MSSPKKFSQVQLELRLEINYFPVERLKGVISSMQDHEEAFAQAHPENIGIYKSIIEQLQSSVDTIIEQENLFDEIVGV